ncbi:MAG: helix-turn-helix domain-containing protein [Candidatus Peribacteraceae bacterium]
MNGLPSSIENFLREAGFSPTEILVLRRLLEDGPQTLRQIAARTGKSTGVLDQAVKKLLRRNIVTREHINDISKYAVVSLAAIAKWMEEDTKQKQEMLTRRHQNFESFIHSLELDQARPEMHYFEGDEGLKQAYMQLLGGGKETLHYFPVLCAIEDDPLRDFRVDYFRVRRRKGIFSRFLVHDTPLGRRFASRDPFEYRKTLLVPESLYPITFEKVIAGDTVACFNHVEKKVCFLKYPELAETERRLFERFWKERENMVGPQTPKPAEAKQPEVPLSTRTFSSLREFLLSRKSLAIFGFFAIVAAAITYGLYRHNLFLNTMRIRERATAIATTGAMRFDVRDIEQLHTEADIKKPEYAKVIRLENEIRDKNSQARYVWIMRYTGTGSAWEFVADADSLNPYEKKDLNGDGKIDDSDHLSPPGEEYFDERGTMLNALKGPFGEDFPTTDQWGTFLTGVAPIVNSEGEGIAVLGIDYEIGELDKLSRESFQWFLPFFGLFFVFILIRLTAFNKSLFKEIIELLKMRKVHITLTVLLGVSALVTAGLYFQNYRLNIQRVRERAIAIATTAAMEFDARDIDQIHTKEDMKKPEFMKLVQHLRQIRERNENILYVYIHRPIGNGEVVADSAYGETEGYEDFNGDGKIDEEEQLVIPGQQYPNEDPYFEEKTKRPFVTLLKDQWGEYFDASAPIYDAAGKTVAVLYVDIGIQELRKLTKQSFAGVVIFFGFFFLFVLIRLVAFTNHSSKRS